MQDTASSPTQADLNSWDHPYYDTLGKRLCAFLLDGILVGIVVSWLLPSTQLAKLGIESRWEQILLGVLSLVKWLSNPFSYLNPLDSAIFPACFMLYRFLAHSIFGRTAGKYVTGLSVVQKPEKKMPRVLAFLLRDTIGFLPVLHSA